MRGSILCTTMTSNTRRTFLGLLAAALSAAGWRRIDRQLPPGDLAQSDQQKRLAAALRDLNDAGRLGIARDDFDRAEAYATGVYRDLDAKLRPIALDDSLDLPVTFTARR